MPEWNEIKRLFRNTLIAAFDWDSLERVLTYHCDQRLDRITSGSEGFEKNVDDVIAHAERNGWLEKLAEGALAENRTHAGLKATVPHILEGVNKNGRAYYQGGEGRDMKTLSGARERPRVFSIPHRPNRYFSGRKAQLLEIEEQFTKGETTLAITGLGGMGKTQLALAYCHHKQSDYQLVYWLRAHDAPTLVESLHDLANTLGLANPEAGDRELVRARLFKWLEDPEVRWLLVYDNVDSMEPSDLEFYLPQAKKGHIIITTRNPNYRDIAYLLELDVFEKEDALDFLRERTKIENQAQLARLAEALGYLPLALEHAAAYVNEKRVTTETYLKYYKDQRKELFEQSKHPIAYHATISTTWDLSLQQMRKQNQEAAIQLLEFFSFLAPEDIHRSLLLTAIHCRTTMPEALQHAIEKELYLDEAIAGLLRFSLLTVEGQNLEKESSPAHEEQGFEIHHLVQEVIRDHMDAEQAAVWAGTAVCLLLDAFREDSDTQTRMDASKLVPHAVAAARLADLHCADRKQLASLYREIGSYLHNYGDYAAALPYQERALALREEELEPDHPDTATSHNDLGLTLYYLDRDEDARLHLEHALRIREKVLGPEDLKTAESMDALGRVLRIMKKYGDAQMCFEQALEIVEKERGLDHADTAKSLNSLGSLLRDMGEYENAEWHLRRALEIREEIMISDHPDKAETDKAKIDKARIDTAESLNSLGSLLRDMDDTEKYEEEAELKLRQALKIREDVLGTNHPQTARTHENLGMLLRKMGKYEEAKSHYEQALGIFEKGLGPEHRDTKRIQSKLSSLVDQSGSR